MKYKMNVTARLMLVFALLLCLPAIVFAQSGTYPNGTSLTGVVQGTNRDLNYVTVRDPATGRDVKVDVRGMNTRESINVWRLRSGDLITTDGGWESADTFRANRVAFSTYTSANSSAAGYTLAGTVESLHRRLNYITVHDQATGRDIKIDVRGMNTRESVNVWQLRPGDPIEATGSWKNSNRFQANRLSVAAFQPMTSGYGSGIFLTGTVQGVNRDLNYITLRDDITGQMMKIDVRKMDTRRSVNVWQLHPGDRIAIEGSWGATHDTFQADTVNF